MTFGAETKTRWLWFLTYIFLPLNVIGQIIGLFQLIDMDMGGFALVFIFAELGLCIATIIGLHQHKPWGWYCILAIFALQLFGTPFKVYQKESLRYEILLSGNRVREMHGQSPIRNEKPSVFDFQPMLTFFLLLGIWTLPNAIYIYRRKHIFGIEEHPFGSGFDDLVSLLPMKPLPGSNSVHAKASNQTQSEPDSAAYAQAWEELESGTRDTGLWAKSFAESEGDEARAKAAYIQHRTHQLSVSSSLSQHADA